MIKNRQNQGITLIALVITIIVMLILVAVTISMAVNGGLFEYAQKAVGETKNAINVEQQLASGKIKVGDKWYASIDDYINNNPIKPGIEITPLELPLKKVETGAEGTEVLTGTITASVFGMENEPEITWEKSSDAIELSATTGKSITVTAVGSENAEVTVTAKCTYEGKEYTKACKVTLEIIEKVETITFKIGSDSYTVAEGTTWGAWASSTEGVWTLAADGKIAQGTTKFIGYEGAAVTSDAPIVSGREYVTLITFTIGDEGSFTAVEGMDWSTWLSSDLCELMEFYVENHPYSEGKVISRCWLPETTEIITTTGELEDAVGPTDPLVEGQAYKIYVYIS